MKERSSNLNNNLSVEELFLALSGRQSGRNTAAVQQIAHEPVVLSPVVAAARRVMGAQGQPDPPRRSAAGTGPLRALLIAASRDVPQELTRLPLGALLDLRRRAVSVGRVRSLRGGQRHGGRFKTKRTARVTRGGVASRLRKRCAGVWRRGPVRPKH